jgi:hypothetical protein
MEDRLAKLGRIARAFSLSKGEGFAMRARLEAVVASPAARPDWKGALAASWRGFFAAPFGRVASLRPVLATVTVAFLLSGVGVSYAAEGAVPGDILYAVKTRLNEGVHGVFVVGRLDRIEWEGERAARRIEEGEVLIRQGRLDDSARQDIIDGYLEHMEKAAKGIETVGIQDRPAAARIEARLKEQWERGRDVIRKMDSVGPKRGVGGDGVNNGAWREPADEDLPFGSGSRPKKAGGGAAPTGEGRSR